MTHEARAKALVDQIPADCEPDYEQKTIVLISAALRQVEHDTWEWAAQIGKDFFEQEVTGLRNSAYMDACNAIITELVTKAQEASHDEETRIAY